MTRAVFLDRDGVLNRAVVRDGRPFPPATVADFELLPGAADAVGALHAAGFTVIVVTNQPDVANGTQQKSVVEAIHDALRRAVAVDDIKVCYHADLDGCDCRKPLPGMLFDAARERKIDLARSVMVGDRWRDVAAGRAAGCVTVFIDCGYAEQRPDAPDYTVASLAEASRLILSLNHLQTGVHA